VEKVRASPVEAAEDAMLADAAKAVRAEEPAADRVKAQEDRANDSTNRKLMDKAATTIDQKEREAPCTLRS